MDGNRRWARERGLSTVQGHEAGYKAFQSIVRAVAQQNIPHAVFYAFSSENWKREKKEVNELLDLFTFAIKELEHKKNTTMGQEKKPRIRFLGDISRFGTDMSERMTRIENESKGGTTTVWIALSYGGRADIVRAVNEAVKQNRDVTEESFRELLRTAEMPDPDLIIRTSGEMRLSNFLLYESAYSELFFPECYWPDFGETELRSILEAYEKRTRRKGV